MTSSTQSLHVLRTSHGLVCLALYCPTAKAFAFASRPRLGKAISAHPDYHPEILPWTRPVLAAHIAANGGSFTFGGPLP